MEAGLLNLRAIVTSKRKEVNQAATKREASYYSALLKLKGDENEANKKGKKKKEDSNATVEIEQDSKLSQSKLMLEQKAALYNKLKSGTEVLQHDELNDKFLVNFQEKIINTIKDKKEDTTHVAEELRGEATGSKDYNAIEPEKEEEWVEYTDSLGRTKMCQKKDLELMRYKDSFILGFDVNTVNSSIEERRKEFHLKCHQMEEEAKLKKDLHYQDVLFDEARVHGVGYMQFSRDEETRKQQQELLKELRKETLKAEASNAAISSKKDRAMADRLAKVRQRKRLKMGLPAVGLEEMKLFQPVNEETKEKEKPEPPVEEPAKPEPPKSPAIREWDLGKFGARDTVMSQEQWVESRRNLREKDFAPPPLYAGLSRGSSTYSTVRDSNKDTSTRDLPQTSKIEGAGAEFAPPATYEYYAPPSHKRYKKHPPSVDVEESIERGLASLRKMS